MVQEARRGELQRSRRKGTAEQVRLRHCGRRLGTGRGAETRCRRIPAHRLSFVERRKTGRELWLRSRRRIQAASEAGAGEISGTKVIRGAGFEPASSGSKPDRLPLA